MKGKRDRDNDEAEDRSEADLGDTTAEARPLAGADEVAPALKKIRLSPPCTSSPPSAAAVPSTNAAAAVLRDVESNEEALFVPEISVLMPCRNAMPWLPDCVASVLAQVGRDVGFG